MGETSYTRGAGGARESVGSAEARVRPSPRPSSALAARARATGNIGFIVRKGRQGKIYSRSTKPKRGLLLYYYLRTTKRVTLGSNTHQPQNNDFCPVFDASGQQLPSAKRTRSLRRDAGELRARAALIFCARTASVRALFGRISRLFSPITERSANAEHHRRCPHTHTTNNLP